jgi:hypothetical protein
MFPISEEDFKNLESQGKTVDFIETSSQNEIPEGTGWEFWSMKNTPDESKAVWRRIVDVQLSG